MKKFYLLFFVFLLNYIAGAAQEADTIHVVIETNVGTMKAILYNDVPNHVRTFVNRARQGEYNGTLFTRVIPEFMIQGGAPDSTNGAHWPLLVSRTISIRRRNPICRSSSSCRVKCIAMVS